MSARTYDLLMRLIAVVLAMFIAISIVREAPFYLALIGVMVALLLASNLRHRVKEIMVDERSHRINEKATSISYRIYTIATAAFVLIALSFKNSLPSWAFISSTTLAYSLCGLLLIHQACTKYLSKKL